MGYKKTTNREEKIKDIQSGMCLTQWLDKWDSNSSSYYFFKSEYAEEIVPNRFKRKNSNEKLQDVKNGMKIKEFNSKWNLKGGGTFAHFKKQLTK
jgi:hypothetical protein